MASVRNPSASYLDEPGAEIRKEKRKRKEGKREKREKKEGREEGRKKERKKGGRRKGRGRKKQKAEEEKKKSKEGQALDKPCFRLIAVLRAHPARSLVTVSRTEILYLVAASATASLAPATIVALPIPMSDQPLV